MRINEDVFRYMMICVDELDLEEFVIMCSCNWGDDWRLCGDWLDDRCCCDDDRFWDCCDDDKFKEVKFEVE